MPSAALKDSIQGLPDSPGIYIFRDDAGRALYVGKAKSLRKRAGSYLREDLEQRLRSMVDEAESLEFVTTDTEAEALLLEATWIKTRRPPFNVLLRDDKTYPYLKLTNDPYPQIAFTRRVKNDGAEYFGPYLPGGFARRGIKLAQRLFGVRVCSIEIDGKLPRPCLYYDMKRCLGPCVDGLTTPEAYAEAVQQTRDLLSGRAIELAQDLKGKMVEASREERFEDAARHRDALREVEGVGRRQKLASARGEDVDVFGVHTSGGNAAVVVLVMRGGQVLDRREIFFEGGVPDSAERLLDELIPQVYSATTFVPKELHLPVPISGERAVAEWLTARKGERVYVRYPQRGPKVRRVRLAGRNARLAHQRRFRLNPHIEAGHRLAEALELEDPPQRIEGFDISTFQGGEPVASMVVWEGGRMQGAEYRTFNIRSLGPDADDFAAMREAIERRYRRRLDEVGEMPDLILVDGGRGQLNAALSALEVLGVEETPVVGLAKREEEIYLPQLPEPLTLDRRHPGLQLLQKVRDEAHRFAVRHHRRRRNRRTLRSAIDGVRGVGPKRKRALLTHFGSVAGIRDASLEEVQEILGARLGKDVHRHIQALAVEEPVIEEPVIEEPSD